MKETQIALNLLTEITDKDVINSKEYEKAINALVELNEKVGHLEDAKNLERALMDFVNSEEE